mgnify:CR=1 FL=1
MDFIELNENDRTYRVYTYRGQLFRRLRNDSTGNYGIYEQYLPRNKTQQLKQIYGANGDVANVSSSLLLRFPSAKKHNVKNVLRDQVLATFKAYDKTSVLSTFEVDTSQHYEDGVYIYLNVSWAGDDTDAETKSDTLLNNVDAIIANMSTTLPQPFNSVVLSTSLNPVTMKCFVLPTILSITTTYVEDAHNTDVEVKTVGLYDHIGIKINKEDDNEFRRLRNQQITTAAEYYDLSNPGGYDNILNIVGVDPTEDTFIATLFDNDYKKLYTSIQTPTIYMQQTQGTNGELFNETVEGSITLDMNYNDFTAESQSDFIDTMNSETGGDTTIVNTSEGSLIIEYRVIFDVSKTQLEIDDVVTKLNDDVEIQNIINKSTTLNGFVSRKTPNTATKQKQLLTKKPKIIDVIYDGTNTKIMFKTIGSYKQILYKATEQSTFLSTTDKTVDLPPGFISKIDAKLVDVNNVDITTAATYFTDSVSPIITLIGDNPLNILKGGSYVEPGANVTDNSGEAINAVITGTVDINTTGAYVISYNATDSSGNAAALVTRTVNIVEPNNYFDITASNIKVFNYNVNTLTSAFTTNPYKLSIEGGMWTIDPTQVSRFDITRPWTIMFKLLKTGGWHNISMYFNAVNTSPYNNNTHDDIDTYRIDFAPGNDEYKHFVNNSNIFDSKSSTGLSPSFEIMDSLAIWTIVYNGTDITINIVDSTGNAISPEQSFSTVAGQVTMTKGRLPVAIRVPPGSQFEFTDTVLYSINSVASINDYIIYNDVIPPVITLIGDNPLNIIIGSSYVDPGANVTDDSGLPLTPVISGTVDVDTEGTYEITYQAIDNSGNTTSTSRNVIVFDPYNVRINKKFTWLNNSSYDILQVDLLDNTFGQGFDERSIIGNLFFAETGYEFTISFKYIFSYFRNNWGPTLISFYDSSSSWFHLYHPNPPSMQFYINGVSYNNDNITTVADVNYFIIIRISHTDNKTYFSRSTSPDGSTDLITWEVPATIPVGQTFNKWHIGNNTSEPYYKHIGDISNIFVTNSLKSWADCFP